jgi:hypothetical protein
VTISEEVTVSWWGVYPEVVVEVGFGIGYAILLRPEDILAFFRTFSLRKMKNCHFEIVSVYPIRNVGGFNMK